MREVAWIVGLLLVSAGCEVRDRGPEARAEEVAPAAPAPASPDPAELPGPPPPPGAEKVSPPSAQKLREVGAALAAAAEAADQASAAGGTSCERAYNGAVAMARSLHARMGGTGEARVPPRDRFLAGCAELPEPVQRCMVIGYSIQHQDECKRIREESDPALMERVRSLMGQGG